MVGTQTDAGRRVGVKELRRNDGDEVGREAGGVGTARSRESRRVASRGMGGGRRGWDDEG